MNRQNYPRNSQPRSDPSQRPPRNNNPAASSVPNTRQVTPGASVSIVLKDDQPTGEETTGVVQNVLTKRNHPRGIKVRLKDGQVGRVQRMMPGPSTTSAASTPNATATRTVPGATYVQSGAPTTTTSRFTHRYTDVRNEEELEGPPPRSLADFLPAEMLDTREPARDEEHDVGERDEGGGVPVTAKCPICNAFEGDEVAVSHHVERDCLAG